MKTIIEPRPQEIEELHKRVKIMKIFLNIFVAMTILFGIAMALPFEGFDAWFFGTVIFCGILLLVSQFALSLLEQKFNRSIAKDKIIFYEGNVTGHAGFWSRTTGNRGGIHLDGEEIFIHTYDFFRLKVGYKFAYLVWRDLDEKIDSAIGGDAIADLKRRRNLP